MPLTTIAGRRRVRRQRWLEYRHVWSPCPSPPVGRAAENRGNPLFCSPHRPVLFRPGLRSPAPRPCFGMGTAQYGVLKGPGCVLPALRPARATGHAAPISRALRRRRKWRGTSLPGLSAAPSAWPPRAICWSRGRRCRACRTVRPVASARRHGARRLGWGTCHARWSRAGPCCGGLDTGGSIGADTIAITEA